MKKNIATYLAVLSFLFVGVSCSDDNDVQVTTTPYAYITSFAIDNILSPFHDFTVEGKDTIVEKLVSGDEFVFVVDQKSHEIYNIDSLTYGTKVDKVVTTLSYTGVPYFFDKEVGDYVYYYSVDSIDFNEPLKVRITSSDATYNNYYTIKINVHQVDPELLVWENFAVDAALSPVRVVEKDGSLYLFGTDASGLPSVAVALSNDASAWAVSAVEVPSADLSSVQLFGGSFYMLAGGDLYVSPDALVWSLASSGNNLVALPAVSVAEGKMWAANSENILYTTDGVSFTVAEPLPANFPLYGCQSASYPLSTNKNILRTMLVGYADAEKSGDVCVWSKLSTDDEWCAYEPSNEEYKCPSLAGLQVLHYDDVLMAFGGAGVVNDKEVAPFASFYVSKDNGIAWRACKDYNLRLPAELLGCEQPFASTIATGNYIWVITPDAAWRGRVNRLGF